MNSQIVPKLKDMCQDPDKEVAYFATIALLNDHWLFFHPMIVRINNLK